MPPPETGLQLVLDCQADVSTELTYTGPTSADTGAAVDLSAVLSSPVLASAPTLTGTATTGPVAGEQVTLGFGGQTCAGTTDTTGTATCTVEPVAEPGPSIATASFAGDGFFQPASATVAASLAPDQPALWLSPPSAISYGLPTTFSGELDDESGAPLQGQDITFSVGSGTGAQSRTAPTDDTGWASCSITVEQPPGPQPVEGSYLGSADIEAVSSSGQTSVLGEGYWLVGADGTVYPLGAAASYGSLSSSTPPGPPDTSGSTASDAPTPAGPIVGIAPTPDGGGYWLASANGDVYSFGDASDYCADSICTSLSSAPPSGGQVVAITADPDGYGYWLAGADGTVYPLGGAADDGSVASLSSAAPIVSMAATADGDGYWLAASDGTVYPLGNASAFCSGQACTSLASPPGAGGQVVAITANPAGEGYWLTGASSTVYALSGASSYGTAGGGPEAIVGMAPSPDGAGYWLTSAAGAVYSFGDTSAFCAGTTCPSSGPANDIVGIAPVGIYTDYSPSAPALSQAIPVITWPDPSAITYGTALGSAQLDATASVAGTFSYSLPAGTVLGAGANQVLTASFTPADSTDYASTSATATITVALAFPVITWPKPSAITYGTALGAAQLDAIASVPGTFSYLPPAGTVLGAGSQTLSVNFTPADSTDYLTSTASTTLTVNQATPKLTWPNPSAITYGTALGAAQLNATASVPGTFSYSPPAGTVLQPGTQTLTVIFTPTNSVDYTTATASLPITVGFSQACITTTVSGSLTISKGQSVCINGAKVTGSIGVSSGGALWASGATWAARRARAGRRRWRSCPLPLQARSRSAPRAARSSSAARAARESQSGGRSAWLATRTA